MAASSGVETPAQLAALLGTCVARIRKTNEASPRAAVYDVIGAVTGMNGNPAAKAYRDLVARHPEVHSIGVNFRFSGKGNEIPQWHRQRALLRSSCFSRGSRQLRFAGKPRNSSCATSEEIFLLRMRCALFVVSKSACIFCNRAGIDSLLVPLCAHNAFCMGVRFLIKESGISAFLVQISPRRMSQTPTESTTWRRYL